MRPCFCAGGILAPRHLCPIRAIWPIIRQRTEAAAFLFPSLQRVNVNRVLKASLKAAGFPHGGTVRYVLFPPGAPYGDEEFPIHRCPNNAHRGLGGRSIQGLP